MKQSNQIRNLQDIRQISSIQLMAAEMKVERANVRLRSLDSQRASEGKGLEASQAGWRNAISGQSFQLAASAAWSAEILRTENAIQSLTQEIMTAEDVRQELCQAQTALSARCDAIGDLLHSAQRSAQRRREESALEEHAGRIATGWRSACEST